MTGPPPTHTPHTAFRPTTHARSRHPSQRTGTRTHRTHALDCMDGSLALDTVDAAHARLCCAHGQHTHSTSRAHTQAHTHASSRRSHAGANNAPARSLAQGSIDGQRRARADARALRRAWARHRRPSPPAHTIAMIHNVLLLHCLCASARAAILPVLSLIHADDANIFARAAHTPGC